MIIGPGTVLPNGVTATTQSASDNSTKVATTAYVETAVAAVPTGASMFDATVGSGGDYADIQAAITGVGGTNINLLLVSNVTEDSDVAVPASGNLYIYLDKYILDMGDWEFTYSAAADVYIKGNGPTSGSELTWAASGTAPLFNNGAYNDGWVDIQDCLIDNNSTSNSADLADEKIYLRSVRFELPNFIGTGVTANNYVELNGVEFVGAGSYGAIAGTQMIQANDIVFSGTWSTSLGENINTASGVQQNWNNIDYRGTTNNARFALRGNVNNLTRSGSASLYVVTATTGGNFTNILLQNGDTIDVLNNEGRYLNVMVGTLDLSDTAALNNDFTNVRSELTSITIGGDDNRFTNCVFSQNVTVASTADDCGFVNCQIGADNGGGSNTLTISASATGTRVIGCMTDAAISDSGTGTVLLGNTVY